MIGRLPEHLNINGVERAIRSDFRVALLIFQAYNDPEMSEQEIARTIIGCLYKDIDNIPFKDHQEAYDKATWFLDGGKLHGADSKHHNAKKVIDWEQDEQIIFSAINKVAGHETRAVEYMHWWTFLGYFNEIGEGLLSTVINIRQKKNKSKKLEKHEQEFYRENKTLIDIEIKLTPEEQAEKEYYEKLLG